MTYAMIGARLSVTGVAAWPPGGVLPPARREDLQDPEGAGGEADEADEGQRDGDGPVTPRRQRRPAAARQAELAK